MSRSSACGRTSGSSSALRCRVRLLLFGELHHLVELALLVEGVQGPAAVLQHGRDVAALARRDLAGERQREHLALRLGDLGRRAGLADVEHQRFAPLFPKRRTTSAPYMSPSLALRTAACTTSTMSCKVTGSGVTALGLMTPPPVRGAGISPNEGGGV